MKVILLQDIKKFGKKGDVVNITDGYVRNYLIPNNMVKLATNQAIAQENAKKKHQTKLRSQELEHWKQIKEILTPQVLKFQLKANKNQVFGSITMKDIINFVEEKYQVTLNKKQFIKFENIHNLGTNKINLKLDDQIFLDLTLEITAQK